MAWDRIAKSTFFIRMFNWEYWPFGVVQFPLFFYYPWLSLRARSFTFFAASNPGILMGGMFGESKYDVLKLIPGDLIPGTIRITAPSDSVSLQSQLRNAGLSFPLIFKPDIGERGFMVRRINTVREAELYLQQMPHDFLAQELVDLPLEFGVFYSRHPDTEKGSVTSVVMKEMLCVTGDGKSTLEQLILAKPRAKLQWHILKIRYKDELGQILPKDKVKEIVSIGNHCLGTKFINANHLITDRLTNSFDRISKAIPGFYFGRFDLRCATVDDLQDGRVKILELNGCGAEPAHIYDPRFSFWRAVGVLVQHWRTIFEIARANAERGTRDIPLKEAMKHYRTFKQKTRPARLS